MLGKELNGLGYLGLFRAFSRKKGITVSNRVCHAFTFPKDVLIDDLQSRI